MSSQTFISVRIAFDARVCVFTISSGALYKHFCITYTVSYLRKLVQQRYSWSWRAPSAYLNLSLLCLFLLIIMTWKNSRSTERLHLLISGRKSRSDLKICTARATQDQEGSTPDPVCWLKIGFTLTVCIENNCMIIHSD